MSLLLLAAAVLLLPLTLAYLGAALLAACIAVCELNRRRHVGNPASTLASIHQTRLAHANLGSFPNDVRRLSQEQPGRGC